MKITFVGSDNVSLVPDACQVDLDNTVLCQDEHLKHSYEAGIICSSPATSFFGSLLC